MSFLEASFSLTVMEHLASISMSPLNADSVIEAGHHLHPVMFSPNFHKKQDPGRITEKDVSGVGGYL